MAAVPLPAAKKPAGQNGGIGSDFDSVQPSRLQCGLESGLYAVQQRISVDDWESEFGCEYGADWTGPVCISRREHRAKSDL